MTVLYEAESGDIRIALTGDALITRKMSTFREERFLQLAELLRGADVTFANAEMLFHNYENPPAYISGGTYARADPLIIKELRWLGVDIVSCANNHAYDFGEGGVLTNIRYLDEAGMPHAGTGRTLADGDVAAEVLKLFQRLSEPFGTRLEVTGDVGVVRVIEGGFSPAQTRPEESATIGRPSA